MGPGWCIPGFRMGRGHPPSFLQLSFMYEPPPGFAPDKKDGEEGEDKLKFDWQQPGRAPPREDLAKGMTLRDKPFGVEVRNVKCIKCDRWGHINTDRECPYYGKPRPPPPSEGGEGPAGPAVAPLPSLEVMEDGLVFRQCVRGRVVDDDARNQQIVASGDEGDDDLQQLLAGFSRKQQRKILR